MITVRVMDGAIVQGRAELLDDDRDWRFTPELPWRGVKYELVADAKLEDVAGNNPLHAFDVDRTASVPGARSPTLMLEWTPVGRP